VSERTTGEQASHGALQSETTAKGKEMRCVLYPKRQKNANHPIPLHLFKQRSRVDELIMLVLLR
jgi:hypothetical protein